MLSTSPLNKAYGALMLMIAAADAAADHTIERHGAEEAQYELGRVSGLRTAANIVKSYEEDECPTG